MRAGIHPDYDEAVVTCGCGNTFTTRATTKKLGVEICSVCHPFYTGKQKLLDTAGMVERFQKKWSSDDAKKKLAEHSERRKVTVQDRAADRAARVMRGELKLSDLDKMIKKEPKPPEPPLQRVEPAPPPNVAATPPPPPPPATPT